MTKHVNFHDSWRSFLSVGTKTTNSSSNGSRIRIRLENKEKVVKEATEAEFDHIQRAIDELSPEDLAFHGLFGDKVRLVIDMPTANRDTPTGQFINLWKDMGYAVDWEKGTISGQKPTINTHPSAVLDGALSNLVTTTPKMKTFNMKIGKFFSKLGRFYTKLKKMEEEGIDSSDTRKLDNYYRTKDMINMMITSETRIKDGYTGFKRSEIPTQHRSRRRSRWAKLGESVNYVLKWADYWGKNAGSIKDSLLAAMANEFAIIITRDPVDVWRMSDFDDIVSCHSPPSRPDDHTEFYKCAVAEAHGHGAVAYLVRMADLLLATDVDTLDEVEDQIQEGEIFGDTARPESASLDISPVSRLRLRQFRYYDKDVKSVDMGFRPKRWDEGTQLAVPEGRMYGEKMAAFEERVNQWAKQTQAEQIEKAPKTDSKLLLNRFYIFGGSYRDTGLNTMIMGLFPDGQETEGSVKENFETEENLELDLTTDVVERWQNECNAIAADWNRRWFHHTEVSAEVDDDYGEAYIIPKAITKVSWPEDEWVRRPNAEVIGWGLAELHEFGHKWVREYAGPLYQEVTAEYGTNWGVKIEVVAEHLEEFEGAHAYNPEGFEEYCQAVRNEVDGKNEALTEILALFFKREGYLKGGELIKLGQEIENGELEYYNWEVEAEEGDEYGTFEFVLFKAHPEVWYKELGATEEEATDIFISREFWINLRDKMVTPALKEIGGSHYPTMPLDMEKFGRFGTEDESQQLILYFSAQDTSSDEQIEALRATAEMWDDQEDIDRIANEVFADMLKNIKRKAEIDVLAGVADAPTPDDLKEELIALRIEKLLKRI